MTEPTMDLSATSNMVVADTTSSAVATGANVTRTVVEPTVVTVGETVKTDFRGAQADIMTFEEKAMAVVEKVETWGDDEFAIVKSHPYISSIVGFVVAAFMVLVFYVL